MFKSLNEHHARKGKKQPPCCNIADFAKMVGVSSQTMKAKLQHSENKPVLRFKNSNGCYYALKELSEWYSKNTNIKELKS